MKYLFIILFFGTNIITKCFSQDITPFRTSEFCPNTEYTFTVSIPKPYDRMIGVGGCFVTQLPTPPVGTTFTFKGKFWDANMKQAFRIYYTDETFFDFDFKKIKSLFLAQPAHQYSQALHK